MSGAYLEMCVIYILWCRVLPANGTWGNMACDSRIIPLWLCIGSMCDYGFAYAIIYATKWENHLHAVILLINLSRLLPWELQVTKCSKKDKSHSIGNGSLGVEWWAQPGINWLPGACVRAMFRIGHVRRQLILESPATHPPNTEAEVSGSLGWGKEANSKPQPTWLKRECWLYINIPPKACPVNKKQ